MEANYLLPPLQEFYREMGGIMGRHFILNSFIQNFKRSLTKEDEANRDLLSMMTTYRDLTQRHGEWNLYDTGYHYTLEVANLEREVAELLSWEHGLTLSQAYEAFETFLISTVTDLLSRNKQHFATLKIPHGEDSVSRELIRVEVKSAIGGKRNNKGLIAAIRKLSVNYKAHESNNIWNINISTWFNLLSEIRHQVVHGRQRISKKLTDLVAAPESKELFQSYFEKRPTPSGEVLFIDEIKLNQNIDLLHSFAHFVFKSLSVDFGLEPNYHSS